MTRQLHHFVAGAVQAGRSGRMGAVFDPASGQVAAQVPLADASEVAAAVEAAQAAFPAWAATPPPSPSTTSPPPAVAAPDGLSRGSVRDPRCDAVNHRDRRRSGTGPG